MMKAAPQPPPAPAPPEPVRIPSPNDPDIAAQNRARMQAVFGTRRGRSATRLADNDGEAYTRTTLG